MSDFLGPKVRWWWWKPPDKNSVAGLGKKYMKSLNEEDGEKVLN